MNVKSWFITILLVAAAGWAVWYYFIRDKSPGEKLDGAARSVERSINDAVRSVTK